MATYVSNSDFIRFLNATRANSACPGCSKSPSKWSLFTSEWEGESSDEPVMEELFHRFRKVREEDGQAYGISTFAMFCQNCGHVEHIYKPVAVEWLRSNPARKP